MTTPTLVKLVAPAYWTRWQVRDGDRLLGTVEKRGMGSPWYVKAGHALHGGRVDLAPSFRTRQAALDALVAATTEEN